MTEQKVSSGTRLGTMFLDHIIMTMVAMVFFAPILTVSILQTAQATNADTTLNIFSGWRLIGFLGFAVYFCKDCINGRSIAKRILKLQLVDNKTGQVASPLKCFARNIFCVLWPIEGIVALINPSRRIGDFVAGTRLIPFDSTLEQPKPNYKQIAIALAIASGLILLLVLPFNTLQKNAEKENIYVIESSYSETLSKQIEKLYADSLGQYLTAEVRVYDKVENDTLKYVSAILKLKDNYMEDDEAYRRLKSNTLPLLFSVIPEESFVGLVKYVYQKGDNLKVDKLRINWDKASKRKDL